MRQLANESIVIFIKLLRSPVARVFLRAGNRVKWTQKGLNNGLKISLRFSVSSTFHFAFLVQVT